MTSLWGDGWFYISALGFLVSSAFFLYLLGQYRASVEDAEEPEASGEEVGLLPKPASAAAMNAPTPVVTPIVAAPADVQEEKTLTMPPPEEPKPAAFSGERRTVGVSNDGGPFPEDSSAPTHSRDAYTGPERRRSELTSTGSISPAVVYLQNIKSQMEKFDKEILGLKSLAAQQAAQGDLLLRRISELAEAVQAGTRTSSVERESAGGFKPEDTAGASVVQGLEISLQSVSPKSVKVEPVLAPETSVPEPAATAVEPRPVPAPQPAVLEPAATAVEPQPVLAPQPAVLEPAATAVEPQPVPAPQPAVLEPAAKTQPVATSEMSVPQPAEAEVNPVVPAKPVAAPPPDIQRDVKPFTKSSAPPTAVPPAPARPSTPSPVVIESLPQTPEQPAETSKPRKGPVWPV
ncbi:MAG TPA: hypothetical protein DEB40_00670 [Elusimicrobia bacterium]|nr:hypothetical protein [Elusimicrobiota bacterium]HBT60241.1 hypothetical protein [Elusimicrobiota bacterium]